MLVSIIVEFVFDFVVNNFGTDFVINVLGSNLADLVLDLITNVSSRYLNVINVVGSVRTSSSSATGSTGSNTTAGTSTSNSSTGTSSSNDEVEEEEDSDDSNFVPFPEDLNTTITGAIFGRRDREARAQATRERRTREAAERVREAVERAAIRERLHEIITGYTTEEPARASDRFAFTPYEIVNIFISDVYYNLVYLSGCGYYCIPFICLALYVLEFGRRTRPGTDEDDTTFFLVVRRTFLVVFAILFFGLCSFIIAAFLASCRFNLYYYTPYRSFILFALYALLFFGAFVYGVRCNLFPAIRRLDRVAAIERLRRIEEERISADRARRREELDSVREEAERRRRDLEEAERTGRNTPDYTNTDSSGSSNGGNRPRTPSGGSR